MRAPTRVPAVLLRSAFVLTASAGLLELGSRVRDQVRGKPWDGGTARARIAEACRTLSRRPVIRGGHQDAQRMARFPTSPILHPYTAWTQLFLLDRFVDEVGPDRDPRSGTAYDIYLLGGSVAFDFGLLGSQPLVEGLKRDPRFRDREVRVHTFALWGYKQMQQVAQLAYALDLGHEPDAVIELDGLNEAAQGWINARADTHPLYPSVFFWSNATYGLRPEWEMVEILHELRVAQDRAAAFGERLLGSSLWRGSFLGQLGLARFERLRGDHARAHTAYRAFIARRPRDSGIKGPGFPTDAEGLASAIVRGWEESSISLHAMCAARGITYLHVLQPTLHDGGSKPLTEREIEAAHADPDWVEGVARCYPAMRTAGARLAERGIPFCDASGVFRDHPEDIYADVCHFKEHGNAILAAAVAEALLEAEPR